jgi:hypothetical protein
MKPLRPKPMSTMPRGCPARLGGMAATSCPSMPNVWLCPASVDAAGTALPAAPARFRTCRVQAESLEIDSRVMESPRAYTMACGGGRKAAST